MTRTLICAALILAPLVASASEVADKKSIAEALQRWDSGWKQKDAKLAASDYSDDADWVNAFGMRRKGQQEIQATLAEVFALPFVMAGNSDTLDHQFRDVTPDVVVVVSKVERKGQVAPSGEPLGTRSTTHQRVFQRRNGRWLIVSHLISDARSRDQAKH